MRSSAETERDRARERERMVGDILPSFSALSMCVCLFIIEMHRIMFNDCTSVLSNVYIYAERSGSDDDTGTRTASLMCECTFAFAKKKINYLF